MIKNRFLLTVMAAAVFILPVCLGSCPSGGEFSDDDILIYPIALSEYFNIGSKAYAGHSGDAGWLVQDTDDSRIWRLAPSGFHNQWSTEEQFNGVRLWNIDRDLPPKKITDLSAYDGMMFKYRTNMTNTESRMQDCKFWWAYANSVTFNEWNFANGAANPDPALGYRQVIISFARMSKYGAPSVWGVPCNDDTKFNQNVFRNFRFDGRNRASTPTGGVTEDYWLEIVDFAFFTYKGGLKK